MKREKGREGRNLIDNRSFQVVSQEVRYGEMEDKRKRTEEGGGRERKGRVENILR